MSEFKRDFAVQTASPWRPRLRVAGVAVSALLISAAAAGCGSSSGNSAGQSSGDPNSAGVKLAKQFVKDNLANPVTVPLGDTPVSSPAPTGKSIAFLECGVPNCQSIGAGVESAAKALGWKFTRIPAGLSPEEVVKAWTSAIQLKPDAVLIAGFGRDVAAKQIDEFTKDGSPWVGESITDPVGEHGLLANVAAKEDFVTRGQYVARWIVADTNGKANVTLFNSPAFAVLKPYQEAMSAEFKKLCPACKFNVENVNPADAGTKLPGQIVSYLTAHPDVDYVVPSFSDGAIGVPQALKAAGLSDRVKLITQGAGTVPIEQLKNGQVPAFVPEPTQVEGWMMVDALVRKFVGDDVPAAKYATVPRQFLTQANLADAFGSSDVYNGVKDYQAQYKTLWGLGN